jgi:hypothetical protein
MSEHSVSSTRPWFAGDMREGASQLFVETRDRLGILFALVAAISGARVTIREPDATADGLSRDWFFVRS